MRDFRTNKAWQKLDDLAVAIYQVTQSWPSAERYGLTAQLRRAAVSASANVAEGCGRDSIKEYLRFLYIARGSLAEVENYLHLGRRLGYLDGDNSIHHLRAEAGRALHGLIEFWEGQAKRHPA